ncbi:MAG: ABC transporter permease [Myxococcales bacterium]|nr:ABC transporter permease [Myxococcales bacterium]
MLDHILSALQALTANKVRSALTMLGVIIGVLAVTLLVSVGDGARAYIDKTLSGIGTNLLIVQPGRRETRGLGGPPTGNISRPLTMDDVTALKRQGTLLRDVSPIVAGGGAIRFENRQRDSTVFGVGAGFGDLRNMHVDVGSFIREEDLTARRRVAVVGRTVAKALFGNDSPLGRTVRISDGRFRIVGILEKKGTSLGFDLDDLVFIPATTASDLFHQDFLSQILTAARNKAEVQQAILQIEEILARRRNGENEVTVQSQDDLIGVLGTVTSAMTAALLAIASVSLLVGGIGIMNIMLVSVRERTREIGVRRALGATRHDILLQFLIEALVLATVGGLIGLGIGGGLIAAVNSAAPDVPLKLSPWIATIAFGASFAVGIASGVVPARRAAELDPVDALRYE